MVQQLPSSNLEQLIQKEAHIDAKESKNKKEIFNYIGEHAKVIRHPYRLLITGRSTLGKTTLATQVMCHLLLCDVKRIFVCCPTFNMQDTLKEFRNVPGAFTKDNVFTNVDEEAFDTISEIIEKTPDIPTLLFVDDSGSERSTNRGSKGSFARLCIAAPHLNLSIVGVFQYMKMVTNQMRYNCEGLVSFIPCSIFDVDYIYQEFNPCATDADSKKVVRAALRKAYEERRFCFISREKWTGKVLYHAGFDKLLDLENEQPKIETVSNETTFGYCS